MQKNNITLSFKNIISFLNNLTGHFTEKEKIIILSLAILMLSFVNIINISALSYESSVGVGFTFNPTLSVSLSSSDLVISNLTPGSSANSNSINVSVATNASYGYTLSVNASSDDLVHSNNVNTFSSIALDADLSNLTTDNTWGYTASLDNGSTWNNYNGLSSSSSTTLLDKDNNISSGIDFKIAAKAGGTQASGTYTNTITFTAVTKPTPMTLAEAYASEGKTMINGFYTMQDMTSTICEKTEAIGAQLQVLDIRDYKVYWIAKLADQKCWMTQNLDLDLDSNRTYTHWDTDLGWSTENGNSIDKSATWQPMRSTINFDGATTTRVAGWTTSNTEPYSANPGDMYYYTSNSNADDMKYNSLRECIVAGHNDCTHYHAGNYYNWSAAVANNNTSDMTSGNASNSICPSEWKLPTIETSKNDFKALLYEQGIIASQTVDRYTDTGFNNVRKAPIFLVRPGGIWDGQFTLQYGGIYWSKTISVNYPTSMDLILLNNSRIQANDNTQRNRGVSVRCLAR